VERQARVHLSSCNGFDEADNVIIYILWKRLPTSVYQEEARRPMLLPMLGTIQPGCSAPAPLTQHWPVPRSQFVLFPFPWALVHVEPFPFPPVDPVASAASLRAAAFDAREPMPAPLPNPDLLVADYLKSISTGHGDRSNETYFGRLTVDNVRPLSHHLNLAHLILSYDDVFFWLSWRVFGEVAGGI